MRSLNIIWFVTLLSLSAKAQYTQDNLRIASGGTQKIYRYKNLQLYPVRANDVFVNRHKSIGNYVTLQEGLKSKKVMITEHVNDPSSTGGTVNTLYIENISSDTVMVLSGEVVSSHPTRLTAIKVRSG